MKKVIISVRVMIGSELETGQQGRSQCLKV